MYSFMELDPTYRFIWASLVAQMVKNLPTNTGDVRDVGLIPGSGRSPGDGNPLQYFCLGNTTDRGPRWAVVHGIKESHMT